MTRPGMPAATATFCGAWCTGTVLPSANRDVMSKTDNE